MATEPRVRGEPQRCQQLTRCVPPAQPEVPRHAAILYDCEHGGLGTSVLWMLTSILAEKAHSVRAGSLIHLRVGVLSIRQG
eukprot:1714392-Alexandrium_andersonii.AAC.1